MKTVTANALVPKGAGQRQALGDFRHRSMKGGIKTSCLRCIGEAQADRFDPCDLCGQMQRRERDEGSELLAERSVRAPVQKSLTEAAG